MERRELNRMFDRLAPTPEQEQAVLDRLLQTERKGKPMKKLKKLTVLGIAAALTVISCAAAVVTGFDQRLADYFGAESEEDLRLIAPADVAVNECHTYENGWTVEISQVLADRLSLAVLVDVTAPEGTVLGKEDQLSLGLTQLDSQGEPVVSGKPLIGFIRQLEDDDPADNHMTVLWQVRKTKGEESVPYIGSSVKLTPLAVCFTEEEQILPTKFNDGDSDTWWSCTVKLPDDDPGITYPVGQPLSVGDNRVEVSGVYVSPLSVTVYVRDEEGVLMRTGWLDWEKNAFLTLADGTLIAAAKSQGKIEGVSYTLCFDQLLDVEKIVSVTLFGQTFELK